MYDPANLSSNQDAEKTHNGEHCPDKYRHYPPAITFIYDPETNCYKPVPGNCKPHHHHHEHPEHPCRPCDCEPGSAIFAAAQFQLAANTLLTVLPNAPIPFNTTLYNSDKFALDAVTGAITITDPGTYKVDYELNITTVTVSAEVMPVKISAALNGTPISSVNNVTLPEQIDATSIIETTDPASILTIINDCPHTLHTDAMEIQANITIVRLK